MSEAVNFGMSLTAAPIPSCPSRRTPAEMLSLSDRDVHVWTARLDLAPRQVPGFAETLSDDEQARASRFSFERDRTRFIVGRGVLRTLLGRYVNLAPGCLAFRYSPHGKPAVSIGPGGRALRFNVAHSGGLALYAITLGREIGIDLERIRADFASDQIAERFFSRGEVAALRALSPARRRKAFFTCWTRKEAYIKARGRGLSLALDRFDVSVAPGEPAALLSTPDEPQEASRWCLMDLYPDPDYVAAIAVEGHGWQLFSGEVALPPARS